MHRVVICSAARTPIGSLNGALAGVSATELGSVAVRAAVARSGLAPDRVDECLIGNVVSVGCGQAPARQVALGADLPPQTVCTTLNKVCSSGLKAVQVGAQQIQLGSAEVVVAGGTESMSQIPHYVRFQKGLRPGQGQIVDPLVQDGLWDPYHDQHMGMCAEACADKFGITRAEQDQYAIQSYERAARAWEQGLFGDEVVAVETPRGTVQEDEEFRNIQLDRIPGLRPAFRKDGTVTAANASSINDGAAALVLCREDLAEAEGLRPLARILSMADAERAPIEFTTAPTTAAQLALQRAGLRIQNVDLHEVNEAFSVVALANQRLLGIDQDRLNPMGGAVALGHPIGCSGARILTTLLTGLRVRDESIGMASICNGGGGASAVVVERLS